MRRLVTTRAQREAVMRLFVRYYGDLSEALVYTANSSKQHLPNATWRSMYRAYRRRFQFGGLAGDYYLFGQPFNIGEGQVWVGIETDGYTHS